MLVDTTYLLPAVGVAIHGVPPTTVKDLRDCGHSISICTITIFELAAKGAKFVALGKLEDENVRVGIRAILNDHSMNQVPYHESDIIARAIAIRASTDDFIDCLILSSAAARADVLVTEDRELQQFALNDQTRVKLKPKNPEFRACSADKLL